MSERIEVKIVGGSHDGEWVEIPSGAHSIRILRLPKPPALTEFDTMPERYRPNDVEEFDLIPNRHFTGFAEAILKL